MRALQIQRYTRSLHPAEPAHCTPPHPSSQGPFIASRRAPRIAKQYAAIGGKSPIGDWTRHQGEALVSKLHARHPELGRFKAYTTFRYAPPLTGDVLSEMAADGVQRAVVFSQYPQWSCTTAGSSLNHLWRESVRLGLEQRVSWSVIDRWGDHAGFHAAVARRIALGLARFPREERDRVIILFSAHSVPMLVVNRGDAYVGEVAATVAGVMAALRRGVDLGDGTTGGGGAGGERVGGAANAHVMSWQSKVGFLPWMGPSTASAIEGLAAAGHTHVLAVPIAFTSDHIETLFEIDLEYAEAAAKAGITHWARAPSLNDEPLLTDAMADILASHMRSGRAVDSASYALNCAGCTNPACRTILNPAAPYTKAREANVKCAVQGWPQQADLEGLRAQGSTPCA